MQTECGTATHNVTLLQCGTLACRHKHKLSIKLFICKAYQATGFWPAGSSKQLPSSITPLFHWQCNEAQHSAAAWCQLILYIMTNPHTKLMYSSMYIQQDAQAIVHGAFRKQLLDNNYLSMVAHAQAIHLGAMRPDVQSSCLQAKIQFDTFAFSTCPSASAKS